MLAGFAILLPNTYAEKITQNFEGGMDIEISFPDEIVAGREGVISILVKNNGWEEKQDISFVFSNDGNTLDVGKADRIIIEKLAQGGSYGGNIDLKISSDTKPGIHFLNLKYSHVLVANNETPQDAIFHDIAIPITVKEDANVRIYTKMPESIFANAEFPIQVELVSEDIDITNVNIKIIPPKDIEFRGETSHTFSKIQKSTPVGITSRIIAPTEEVNTEYKLPFEIIVIYTDDVGEEKQDSQTVSVILRPRTFMELTTDGGIWIGDFFIAPYVSLGTIIGIPAGTIISLLIRKNQKTAKKRPKKKKV
ncbi:COG1361 family protein [Nitrosopumilus sp. S4]